MKAKIMEAFDIPGEEYKVKVKIGENEFLTGYSTSGQNCVEWNSQPVDSQVDEIVGKWRLYNNRGY